MAAAHTVSNAETISSSSHDSTQSTQSSQQETHNPEIWGSLIPLNPDSRTVFQVDFRKKKSLYVLGTGGHRSMEVDCVFKKASSMSRAQCAIEWDGKETSDSAVIITALGSRHGTWINGCKIDKGTSRVLRNFNIVTFTRSKNCSSDSPKDDRFLFRTWHPSDERHNESRSFLCGHYDVQCVLGEGAFGKVVKGLHVLDKTWVAIKMIPNSRLSVFVGRRPGVSSKTATRQLKQEISILEQLNHRNIVQLKGAFDDDRGDGICMVMEFVSGGDLMSYIVKHGTLGETDTRYFAYQICDALVYIHSQGIVHRDLKPDNVLLTCDDPPVVKVADFGLAKLKRNDTMLKTACGTPLYTAPEVISNGDLGYNEVADSWSLGVTLGMMLFGRDPFHKVPSMSISRKLAIDFCVSKDCTAFLFGLLERSPHQRMTSAEALKHLWLAAELPSHGLPYYHPDRQLKTLSAPVRGHYASRPLALQTNAPQDTRRTARTSCGAQMLSLDTFPCSFDGFILPSPQPTTDPYSPYPDKSTTKRGGTKRPRTSPHDTPRKRLRTNLEGSSAKLAALAPKASTRVAPPTSWWRAFRSPFPSGEVPGLGLVRPPANAEQ